VNDRTDEVLGCWFLVAGFESNNQQRGTNNPNFFSRETATRL